MDVIGWLLRKPVKTAVAAMAHARPCPGPKDPKRVLVVREGGFGDLILTVPIIRTLRQHLGSNVVIDALVREQVVGFYKDLDQIDLLFAKTSKLSRARTTIRQMRSRRYDLVVDLVSSPSLSFALWIIFAAPGAHRIGGDKAELKGMYHQHIELPPRPSIHFIERLHRIGRQAYGDRPIADEVPWINWPDDVHQEADRIWHSLVGESSPGQAVLVNMSAGIPRRTWPDEKYRELMPRLLEEYGDKVARWVVTAAPHEHHRATELVTFCNHPNLIALPEIPDFRVVAALVARFLLVITPDTSIVHACSAHGTPVVMFTVAENVIAWAPWGVEHGMVACEKTEWTESIPVDDLIAAICQTSASDTTTSA